MQGLSWGTHVAASSWLLQSSVVQMERAVTGVETASLASVLLCPVWLSARSRLGEKNVTDDADRHIPFTTALVEA
jgi:hypothetical protein